MHEGVSIRRAASEDNLQAREEHETKANADNDRTGKIYLIGDNIVGRTHSIVRLQT